MDKKIVYFPPESIAEYVGGVVSFLMGEMKKYPNQPLKYEIPNGIPFNFDEGDVHENVVSLQSKATEHDEGWMLVEHFLQAMEDTRIRILEDQAQKAGYELYFDYTLVMPTLRATPRALRSMRAANFNPLLDSSYCSDMELDSVEIFLMPQTMFEAGRKEMMQRDITKIFRMPKGDQAPAGE